MCFKTPKPPAVREPPRRDAASSAVQDAQRQAAAQSGSYANLVTGPLGDSTYGTNTVSGKNITPKLAKLGAA